MQSKRVTTHKITTDTKLITRGGVIYGDSMYRQATSSSKLKSICLPPHPAKSWEGSLRSRHGFTSRVGSALAIIYGYISPS